MNQAEAVRERPWSQKPVFIALIVLITGAVRVGAASDKITSITCLTNTGCNVVVAAAIGFFPGDTPRSGKLYEMYVFVGVAGSICACQTGNDITPISSLLNIPGNIIIRATN